MNWKYLRNLETILQSLEFCINIWVSSFFLLFSSYISRVKMFLMKFRPALSTPSIVDSETKHIATLPYGRFQWYHQHPPIPNYPNSCISAPTHNNHLRATLCQPFPLYHITLLHLAVIFIIYALLRPCWTTQSAKT